MRALYFFSFVLYYIKEFLKANFQLLRDILRRKSKACPAIVKVDLQSKSHIEITAIASLISLTPGSLTLSIKANPPTLFVHGVYVENVEEFRDYLQEFEEKMLKVFRPVKEKRDR